ncbi:MAG: hypothetical protein ACJ75H_22220, partial [Thermoanaerobaculia bacterium]
LYLAMLAVDPSGIRMGGLFSIGAPSPAALVRFGAAGAIPVFGLDRWWTVQTVLSRRVDGPSLSRPFRPLFRRLLLS